MVSPSPFVLDDLSDLGFRRSHEGPGEYARRHLGNLLRAAGHNRVKATVFIPGQSVRPGGEEPARVRDRHQARKDAVMSAARGDDADRAG